MTSRERFEAFVISRNEAFKVEDGTLMFVEGPPAGAIAWDAWQAAERDALERAVDVSMNAALDDMTNQAAFDTWRRVRKAIGALIEQDNKETK